jgi:hypothetical protein
MNDNEKYWQERSAELQFCLDNNSTFTTTVEDLRQEIIFFKEERQRLIKKLQEIENLSKYAWEQVDRNPAEAKELFKTIHAKSK